MRHLSHKLENTTVLIVSLFAPADYLTFFTVIRERQLAAVSMENTRPFSDANEARPEPLTSGQKTLKIFQKLSERQRRRHTLDQPHLSGVLVVASC